MENKSNTQSLSKPDIAALSKPDIAEKPEDSPLFNPMKSSYKIAADTHIGLVRENNEDSYAYYANPLYRNFFVAVADGIGGHDGGDVASSSCVRMMLSSWKNKELGNIKSKTKLQKFLETEIIKSNQVIHSLNKAYGIQFPMGTTVVAGIFLPESLIIGHAGDSRCYRTRDKKLKKLTNDHSFVEDLVQKQVITEDEAREHPLAHIISKSIGPSPELEPEINTVKREPKDRYLFCTDGLVNHMTDIEIEKIMIESKDPDEAVKALLYTALQGGGEDNITLVCVFT